MDDLIYFCNISAFRAILVTYICSIMTVCAAPKTSIADAAVVFTGYYQFAAHEKIVQPRVQSRMFLWCKIGKGTLHINGQSIPMAANDFCFLPWNRSQVYQADGRDPFMTGGIHLIPFHRRRQKLDFAVAHSTEDPLFNRKGRRDLSLGILEGIKRGSLNEATTLHLLAEYIVQRFREREPEEWEARALAQLLLAQMSAFFQDGSHGDIEMPLQLRRMIEFIQHHRGGKIDLADLARVSGLSASAVGRMFKRHLKLSPVKFIIREKINHAKNLLVTSREQVGEIGRRVGIDDPYYFSKLFRKTTGYTPLTHRRKASFL